MIDPVIGEDVENLCHGSWSHGNISVLRQRNEIKSATAMKAPAVTSVVLYVRYPLDFVTARKLHGSIAGGDRSSLVQLQTVLAEWKILEERSAYDLTELWSYWHNPLMWTLFSVTGLREINLQ